MDANRKYPEAKELTYSDFPSKFVWNQPEHQWYPMPIGESSIMGDHAQLVSEYPTI